MALIEYVPYLIVFALLLSLFSFVQIIKLKQPKKLAVIFVVTYIIAYLSMFTLRPYTTGSLILIAFAVLDYIVLLFRPLIAKTFSEWKGFLTVATLMMLDLYCMMQIMYFMVKS